MSVTKVRLQLGGHVYIHTLVYMKDENLESNKDKTVYFMKGYNIYFGEVGINVYLFHSKNELSTKNS